jgi:NDP-sugar pyrophosphorylase family protein
MAGHGSRFIQEGYTLPKPLIPVHGVPMIELVVANLRPEGKHRFIFLCLKEHIEKYSMDTRLKSIAADAKVLSVDTVTEGAACTVLLAKEFISNDDPLMVANSDQWVDLDINDYLGSMEKQKKDGFIMTMWADHPKWSYIRLDKNEHISEVVEKQVVSNEATVGIYNYAKGNYFVRAVESMITKDLRVNGEFYVAPAYNEMITDGLDIGYYNIGREYDGMYGMGIPSDLKKFENFAISKKALASL